MESADLIALAGVLTALVSTVTASVLSFREAAASRTEREKDRTLERRQNGRREALSTLTPLFAFVADLESVARQAERDPVGFARFAQGRTFSTWTTTVRPLVIGIQVSSISVETRNAAAAVVSTVDDALVSATFELEYSGEELDGNASEDAHERLVGQVRHLRDHAELLAARVREDT